jgi:osmotically-inducible protein OsmY
MVDHSDHDRIGFHKLFFHTDWDDENLYDLMLNTQFFPVEQAVRLIMTSLEMSGMREKKAETAQKLSDLCLGQHVMTELAYKEGLPVQFLEASVEQGVVTLKGTAFTSTDIHRCEEIARKVPGVNSVVNTIISKDRDE